MTNLHTPGMQRSRSRFGSRVAAAVLLAITVSRAVTAAEPALLDAARRRDLAAVRALLQAGADANAAGPDGTTALHWAAHWDDERIAAALLGAGARADERTDLGATPLFLAAENGSAHLLTPLLKAGANPNAELASGETPLMTAARTGNADAVLALLSAGADVNHCENSRHQTALMWAVAQKHTAVVRLLVDRGADVHARTVATRAIVNTADAFNNMARRTSPRAVELAQGGFTPLLFAARVGDVESAAYLLAHGASVDEAGADGVTALTTAVHSDHAVLADLLLRNGAKPNALGGGYAALHAAVLRGNADAVRSLLGHGADANVRVVKGTRMTRYGADYAIPEAFVGATPLFLAARLGEVEVARLLLAAGADPTIPTRDRTTPLMQAAGLRVDAGGLRPEAVAAGEDESAGVQLVSILVKARSEINGANEAGDTALHGAASKGWNAVVRALVQQGALVDAPNKKGQTPFSLSSRRQPRDGDVSTADLLRSLGAKP